MAIPMEENLEASLDWEQHELAEGMRCYHAQKFFDAHEHWEIVWLKLQHPEKEFLQALIQVSAAFHHFKRGNKQGTASLLRAALNKLGSYPEIFAGVSVTQLRIEIAEWLLILKGELVEGNTPQFPQILENN